MTAVPGKGSGTYAVKLLALLLLAAISLPVSGCSGPAAHAACKPPAARVVASIKRAARVDFTTGPTHVTHVSVLDAAQVSLPASQRAFGFTDVIEVLTRIDYTAGQSGGGVQETLTFVSDDSGREVKPVGPYSAKYFNIATSRDPGWTEWSQEVYESSAATDAYSCVHA